MSAPIYLHAAGGIGLQAAPVLDLQRVDVAKLEADAQPISLRELSKSLRIAMPRLASRFAELAVIGARSCVNRLERPLPQATPVYLATGLGDVARTDALYYQVMPPSNEMASPAQFATSGNNMAAFFVAQQLGLVSRNFTISQQDLSLEHGLTIALDDLVAGGTTTALVGGVDETTLPRDFYVRRYPLCADKYIGEGSAWLVLGTEPIGAIGEVIGVSIVSATADDDWADCIASAMRSFIESAGVAMLMPGARISKIQVAALLKRLPALVLREYRDFTGCLPTAAALAVVSTFANQPRMAATYLHVNCDVAGRTGLIAWRVNR